MARKTAAQKLTPLEALARTSTNRFEKTQEDRPNPHFEFDNITIVDENEHGIHWNVLGGTLKAQLEMTITGASVLRLDVEDPQQEFLNDKIFQKWMFTKIETALSSGKTFKARKITDSKKTARYGEEQGELWVLPQKPIDLNCDGVWFRLTGFQVEETTLTLIFEDRVAAILREQVGTVISKPRGQFTRAEFVEYLCKQAEKTHRNAAKVKFFIPEAKIHQKIAEQTSETVHSNERHHTTGAGISSGSGLTLGGEPLNGSQINTINQMLETAQEKNANRRVMQALVLMAIGESRINPNDNVNTSGYGGLLGSSPSFFPHLSSEVPQVVTAAIEGGKGYVSLRTLAQTKPKANIDELAVLSANPGALGKSEDYVNQGDPHAKGFPKDAESIVNAWLGGGEGAEGGTLVTVPGAYAFTRGQAETSWDCIQRLASEVSWYAFVRNNALWYISGNFLLAQEAKMDIEKGERGIDWVNPHIEIGARDKAAEIEVHGRALPFTALPGMCVNVARVGPANGKWVVENISVDVMDRSDKMIAKLVKPLPARPEPAATPEVKEKGAPGSPGGPTGNAKSQSALAAFNASSALSEFQIPYLWGGGHGPNQLNEVKKGFPGLDCSGSTCWVLKQAGMFNKSSAEASPELEHWGASGPGKEMTVWAGPNHVYIEFNIPGHGAAQMNTNGPQNGPRLYTLATNPTYNSANGGGSGGPFVARHWPGT